jgi:hypothetical protein
MSRSAMQADRHRLKVEVLALRDQGLSYPQIGDRLGLPPWTARRLALADVYRSPPPKAVRTQRQKKRTAARVDRYRLRGKVLALRGKGLSFPKIGELLGIPPWLARRLAMGYITPQLVSVDSSDGFIRKVAKLRDQGLPDTEIAIQLDVTVDTVRNWAGPRGSAQQMADRRAWVIQLHEQGVRPKDIICRTGAAESTVGKWLREYRKMAAGQCDRKSS